jgi:hypothetical protein
MSFGGKLAQGLLAGVAGYYGEQYKSQEKDKDDAVLLARQQALAQFENTLQEDRDVKQGDINRKTAGYEATARVAMQNNQFQQQQFMEVLKNGLDQQSWTARNKVEFSQAMSKLGKEQGYAVALKNLENAFEIQRQAIAAGQQGSQLTDKFFLGNDGSLVGVTRDGNRVPIGSDLRPAGNGNDEGMPTMPGTGPAPGSGVSAPGAQPMAAAVPPPAPRTTPDSHFLTAYANSNPQTAPGLYRNGQRIPLDQAWQAYQQAGQQ